MNFKFLTMGSARVLRVLRGGAPRSRAFTMIEIAISLAVIGFAVVAIIGVLPYGLQPQGRNHEDTLINQDGPYLLE
ncbi:MAG: type II secretion system protein, partial [Limisphaerales bacterium]